MSSPPLICSVHSPSSIDLVCSATSCRLPPLFCWQCLLDSAAHSASHRGSLVQIPTFLKQIMKAFNENQQKLRENRLSSDTRYLSFLENGESQAIHFIESMNKLKETVIESLQNVSNQFVEGINEIQLVLTKEIDQNIIEFKQKQALLQKLIDEAFGQGEEITYESMLEQVKEAKDPNALFLEFKTLTVLKPGLEKDSVFLSKWKSFWRWKEEWEGKEKWREEEENTLKIASSMKSLLQQIEKSLGSWRMKTEEGGRRVEEGGRRKEESRREEEGGCWSRGEGEEEKGRKREALSAVKDQENRQRRGEKAWSGEKGNQLQESLLVKPFWEEKEAKKISLQLNNRIPTSHSRQITALKIIGDILFTGSKDRKIKLWNIKKGEALGSIDAHSDGVFSLESFTNLKNGTNLISGGGNYESLVCLWDINNLNGKPVVFQGHRSGVTAICGMQDKRTFVTGSYDNTLIVWDSINPSLKVLLTAHKAMVSTLLPLSPTRFLSGSWDKKIFLWELKTGENEQEEKGYRRENYEKNDKIIEKLLDDYYSIKCSLLKEFTENFAILSLSRSLMCPHRVYVGGVGKRLGVLDMEVGGWENEEYSCSHFGVNELMVLEVSYSKHLIFGMSTNDSSIRIWENGICEPIGFKKEKNYPILENINSGPKMGHFHDEKGENELIVVVGGDGKCVDIFEMKEYA